MQIELGALNGKQTLLIQGPQFEVPLRWLRGDSFQVSGRGLDLPCLLLGVGELGERVDVMRGDGGEVASLTFPGLLYGVVFNKKGDDDV